MITNKRQGAMNGAILTAQVLIFIVGAISLFHLGSNVMIFVAGVILLGGISGYAYPNTIEWAWKQLVKLSHMP